MQLIKTKKVVAPIIVVYGAGGIGKSTFGAYCPSPLFLQTEDGLANIDATSFGVAYDFTTFVTWLECIRNKPEEFTEFKTIVIDSLDWLERLIWNEVCLRNKVNSIAKLGFGKGYEEAADLWKGILDQLTEIRKTGKIIVCLAHDIATIVNDPEVGDLRKFDIKLHKTAKALVTEWADAVFYATRKLGGAKGNISPRVLKTQDMPSHFAKSRYAIPATIENINPLNVIKLIVDAQNKVDADCPF